MVQLMQADMHETKSQGCIVVIKKPVVNQDWMIQCHEGHETLTPLVRFPSRPK